MKTLGAARPGQAAVAHPTRRGAVRGLAAGLVMGALAPAALRAMAADAPGPAVQWPGTVRLLDGSLWQRDPQRAQVVVFWSVTCPFCMRHNQHVARLHRETLREGPQVLTVCRDQDAAVVRRYMAQHGHGFPVTLDHAAMAAALSARRLVPLTVVVDRQGRIRQSIPGEMFEEDVMELKARA